MSPASIVRKLVIAFFLLVLPLSATTAASLFSCESYSAIEPVVSAIDAERSVDALCLQDCQSLNCDEVDEPSPSDHLDVADGLAFAAPATLQGILSFPHPRAGPASVDYAPLKPPPTL